jgi:hypothetical protein
MKNILINAWKVALLMMSAAIFITGCDDDDSGAVPVLERISLVPKDSTTQVGFRGNTYVIFGKNLGTTQYVYFNGVVSPLNSTLVRNDNIIIQIADNTPYVQPLNKVRVVTKYGEAVMDFVVKQKPVIKLFSPAVASAGDTVVITGTDLVPLQSVKFIDAKTKEAVDAEIVSNSAEQIKVKVPVGTKVSNIAVTTEGGTVVSSSFGFNMVVYAENYSPGWEDWSWGGLNQNSSVKVKSGKFSLRREYRDSWSAISFRLGNGGVKAQELGLTDLKFSMLGGPGTAGKKLQVYIDGVGKNVEIVLKEEWTDYTIKLSDLNAPAAFERFNIQEINNVNPPPPFLMYVDDVGFL